MACFAVEDRFEKAIREENTEKEEERNSTVHDNEREPAAVRLNSRKTPSSGEYSVSAETNGRGHTDKKN